MENRLDTKPLQSQRHSHVWLDFGVSGLGSIILALLAFFFAKNITTLMPRILRADVPSEAAKVYQESPQTTATKQLAMTMVYDTEGTWSKLLSQADQEYRRPTLAFFSGAVKSACIEEQGLGGSFYCAAERKLYVDLSFSDELQRRLGAHGEVAQAYVIAHALGHHVQNLTGVTERTHKAQLSAKKAQRNALSLRLELQADCYAGLWTRHSAESRPVLADGDIEAGLKGVSAASRDRVLREGYGSNALEAFQHGSAEQRERWFQKGFQGEGIEACDTFAVRTL